MTSGLRTKSTGRSTDLRFEQCLRRGGPRNVSTLSLLLERSAESRESGDALDDHLVDRRVTEAHVPFRAKRATGNSGHFFRIEELGAEILILEPETRDIGKQIEGTLGQEAFDPGNLVQFRMEEFAAAIECHEHRFQRGGRFFLLLQRRERAELRER